MVSLPPIRLLLAEDDPADVELELREVRRAGLQVTHRVAASEALFIRALGEFAPDVILSDFSMPQFDGMEALRIARELAPATPFVFVSGTIGESYAIRALKNGATDYVLKGNLPRLPAAIERAVAEGKERRARQSAEAGLARAQRMAKLAHVVTGPGGAFESWSDSVAQLLGIEGKQVPKTTREWLEILHPADRAVFRGKSLEAATTKKRVDIDYRLRRGDGEWIHVRQVVEPLSIGHAPHGERWFNTLQDVTEQKRAENHITRLNRVYAVSSGINSLIVRVRSRDELFKEACRVAVEDGKFPLAWIGALDKTGARLEIAASCGDGEGYLEKTAIISNDIAADPRISDKSEALARGFRSLAVVPLVVHGETLGAIGLYAEQAGFFDGPEMELLNKLAADISFAIDHIEKSEKLAYLSYYDPLTGLANRMLLMDRLVQSVASTKDEKKLGLALIDIERFKSINDALGRRSGDALLAMMAKRLVELAGDANRVAHTGADRFAVIIPDARKEETIARAIDEGFSRVEGEPFLVGDTELKVAIRSGIAIYPNDGPDADSLFRNAEAALKRAKATGERYLFYREKMSERIAEKLSLENKLRRAIERDEFVLHYQPKVDLDSRRVTGLEALIRWNSPELGLISPMQFVPLLEETGMIIEAGSWVLQRALRDQGLWAAEGLRVPRVAVNVSSIQLRQRNFVEQVRQALGPAAAAPLIDFEITETYIMQDIDANVDKLRKIRALGIGVAIDDFGTGYSSLTYLAKLPAQVLKIDRSFIARMLVDDDAMALVQTILSIANSLKLVTVAEGVESEEQADMLQLLRCAEMQGYFVSKPLPRQEITAFLKRD
jgi:diguanylate cyclase (GGDEF)-like protein/PAS domain S-box-containing protein